MNRNKETNLTFDKKNYQKLYYEKNRNKILNYSRSYYWNKKYGVEPPDFKEKKEKPEFKFIYGNFTLTFD